MYLLNNFTKLTQHGTSVISNQSKLQHTYVLQVLRQANVDNNQNLQADWLILYNCVPFGQVKATWNWSLLYSGQHICSNPKYGHIWGFWACRMQISLIWRADKPFLGYFYKNRYHLLALVGVVTKDEFDLSDLHCRGFTCVFLAISISYHWSLNI